MAMIRKTALVLGWLTVAVIVFSTLSPIRYRPRTGYPDAERFAAFFIAGACFAVAYPRYRRWVSVALVVGAGLLEASQLLAPSRHAHLRDAAVKAVGGIAGLTVAALLEHGLALTAARYNV